MDITKALRLSAERMQVKPKQAREMLADMPEPPTEVADAGLKSGGGKAARNRDAANRRIVDRARAQISHTLLLVP